MIKIIKYFLVFYLLNLLFLNNTIKADNHNIYEILETIQKDIKTLEKAVYSGSFELNDQSLNNSNFDSKNNSEDVLSKRHSRCLIVKQKNFHLLHLCYK